MLSNLMRLVEISTDLCLSEQLLSILSKFDWLVKPLLSSSYARRLRGNYCIWIRRYKIWYRIARRARRARYDNAMRRSRIIAYVKVSAELSFPILRIAVGPTIGESHKHVANVHI